jgi:hypothetical protein
LLAYEICFAPGLNLSLLLLLLWYCCTSRTIYAMMGTMFIQQGSMMERNVQLPWTNMSVYIPSATMALFNTGGWPRMVMKGGSIGFGHFICNSPDRLE